MTEKKPPLLESRAVLALFRAADAVRRRFVEILVPVELTLPQYNVLRILRGAGGTLPTMEIRERMMERAPGITRIVDGLVAKGLVTRGVPARDRRKVECSLTAPGRALLSRLDRAMDDADREAFASVPSRRLDGLIAELQSIEASSRKG